MKDITDARAVTWLEALKRGEEALGGHAIRDRLAGGPPGQREGTLAYHTLSASGG